MSVRSKARHVQRVARDNGLEASYQKIVQLLREHGAEIARHRHELDVPWNDAAALVICARLRPREGADA